MVSLLLFCSYTLYSSLQLSLLSLELFQQVALEHGLILVDTKYEFGKAPDGSILLIDEVKP